MCYSNSVGHKGGMGEQYQKVCFTRGSPFFKYKGSEIMK